METGIITQEKSDTIVSVLEEIRVADRPHRTGDPLEPAPSEWRGDAAGSPAPRATAPR